MAKLKEVKGVKAKYRQVWADPRSIDPNPDNWKVHPEEQVDALRDMLSRHDFLLPLLYNEREGRLVNGHARLQVAIDEGRKAVPVWVGEWSPEEEAEILVLLDETARMAEAEPDKLQVLLGRMRGQTAPLTEVVSRLKSDLGLGDVLAKARENVAAAAAAGSPVASAAPAPAEGPLEFVADGDDGDDGGDAGPGPSPPPAASPTAAPVPYVRMVQLFLNSETFPVFESMVDRLKAPYRAVTTTDCVFNVLRAAVAALEGGADAPSPDAGVPEPAEA